MTVEEFKRLKSDVEESRRKLDRLSGAAEESEKTLKNEFGHSSIEEAEKSITKENKELSKMQDELEELKQKFKEKWENKL